VTADLNNYSLGAVSAIRSAYCFLLVEVWLCF